MDWSFRSKTRARSSQDSVADPHVVELFGLSGDAYVTTEQALGVPAVWAAINFLAGTIAGLPLHVFDKSGATKKKVRDTASNPVVSVLHDAVNDELTSFQWRFDLMAAVLTEGRSVSYIERDSGGRVINLFPLQGPTVRRLDDGTKEYEVQTSRGKRVYKSADVIDISFFLKGDGLTHRSPLRQCATALGKAVHSNSYGSKLFANGGLPAFMLQGPFDGAKSASRASDDIARATKDAAKKGGTVLAIPAGHKLEPLGADPEKLQLVKVQEFAVQEVARIYSLPPTFLQDLSRATFTNSEQQDLHLTKHTVKRWLEQIEAELNLKVFGRRSKRIAEFNLDGLLRGDYQTRMNGNSLAIQSGQLTPNEAREQDNREPKAGGNNLLIQGATVPLVGQGKEQGEPGDG